jgi:prephenate dehydratase
VRLIKEQKMYHAGAVASSAAAALYEMEILQESIEDYKQNYTRFFYLGRLSERNSSGIFPKERSGASLKCSMVFTLRHEVGSLHTVLATLAKRRANLTAILSMPILDEPWHYRFFIGFTFESDLHYELIMKELGDLTESVKVLGVYEVGEYFK